MKKLLAGLATGLFIFGMVGVASADFIVDTGTTGTGTRYSLYSDQWLAAEFTIDNDETVSGIEGYIQGGTYQLTTAIYTDGGDLPGSEIYSSIFTTSGSSDNDGWFGAQGLSWFLNSGTYWVSFEVRSGDTYHGVFPGSAVSPLGNEAFDYEGQGWAAQDSVDLGIRISTGSSPDPVPEPATMLLFGTGLTGLIGSRIRRKKKA